MLETYFPASKMLEHLRSGPSGPYLDGFAAALERRVSGKSRYEVRLPLPQDVGDAIIAYLECRPSIFLGDHVFLRTIAPYRPFR